MNARRQTRTVAPVQPPPPTQVTPRGPRPLFAGTVVIGPAGYWFTDFGGEISQISVSNTGNFWMVLSLDAPSEIRPESGPGVHHLEPGGRERRLPGWGLVATIYGTPGERVGIVVWTSNNLTL